MNELEDLTVAQIDELRKIAAEAIFGNTVIMKKSDELDKLLPAALSLSAMLDGEDDPSDGLIPFHKYGLMACCSGKKIDVDKLKPGLLMVDVTLTHEESGQFISSLLIKKLTGNDKKQREELQEMGIVTIFKAIDDWAKE